MKLSTQQLIRKSVLVTILVLLLASGAQASSLEQAQEHIHDFYKYAQEQNVDAYAALFDQEYLVSLYGADYKTGLKEVLSYITITDYKITPQYYTEGEDSLTYFFNLKSNVIIENEKTALDNDLVALFSKKDNTVQLRYVILQETFIEQMNREVIYEAAISSMTEEYSDLYAEAEEKNIPLVDYASLFQNEIRKDKSRKLFRILLVILLLAGSIYIFSKHKEKLLTPAHKHKMKQGLQHAKKHTLSAKTKIVETYAHAAPKIKSASIKTIEKIKANKQYQNIMQKTKTGTVKTSKKKQKKS